MLWLVAAGVVVVVMAIGLGVLLTLQGDQSGGGDGLPRRVTTEGGGVAYGPAGTPVLDVYEDFQCPACKSLEQASGQTIRDLARGGDARVVFYPMSFLGPESDRASAATGCAADAGRYLEYHRVLFENQPAEQTGGYTIEDLVAFGGQAGISAADREQFESCVREGTYTGWADDLDGQAADAGVTRTPTLVLEGRTLTPEQLTPAALRRAVEGAGR